MNARQSVVRTVVLTIIALLAFAANSLLCRAALGPRTIDAASFTAVRIVSGATVLLLLVRLRGARIEGGGWWGAATLFVYAIAFSFAYLRIPAGVGALALFGAVQATMVGSTLLRGERLGAVRGLGLVLALGGLSWLALPGANAPDPLGAALMVLAGISWGIYSLLGRASKQPLSSTAHNFLLGAPLAIAACLASPLLLPSETFHVSPRGLLLAAASGAVASGLGYTIWYMALPHLAANTSAIAQLAVPVIAALGGVALLGEHANPRLITSGLLVLGGVGLALIAPLRTQR